MTASTFKSLAAKQAAKNQAKKEKTPEAVAAKAKKDRNERKKLNEAQTSQLGTFATTWVWEHLKLLEPGYDSFDKNPEIVQKIFARIGVKEDKQDFLREACLSVVKSKIQTKRGNVKQSIGDQYLSKYIGS